MLKLPVKHVFGSYSSYIFGQIKVSNHYILPYRLLPEKKRRCFIFLLFLREFKFISIENWIRDIFCECSFKKKSTPRCGLSKNTRAAVPRCMQCTISRQNPLSTAFGKLRSINTHFVTQLLLWSLSFVHFLEESIFILLLYILLSR